MLEVSCGHGGGASYLMRTLQPASYTALDFNGAGIALCRKATRSARFRISSRATPRACPLLDDRSSFDVVLDVEA